MITGEIIDACIRLRLWSFTSCILTCLLTQVTMRVVAVFQLLNACKTRREGNSQKLRKVATPVFQTAEKKPPQSKVYLCGNLIQTSFCFYFLHASCFYRFSHMGTRAYRQT